MRKLIFAFVCWALLSPQANGQICVVSPQRENVAYLGLPCPLGIAAEGLLCKEISAKTDNGELKKNSSCQYELFPARIGVAKISIYSKKSNKVVGTSVLRVKKIPAPTAFVGGRHSGLMAVNVFRAQLGLSAYVEGMDLDAHFSITHFNMILVDSAGSCRNTHPASTVYFTDEMKSLINTVKRGDKVIFAEITATGPYSTDLQLAPIELVIE